jgi:hypothetical protein
VDVRWYIPKSFFDEDRKGVRGAFLHTNTFCNTSQRQGTWIDIPHYVYRDTIEESFNHPESDIFEPMVRIMWVHVLRKSGIICKSPKVLTEKNKSTNFWEFPCIGFKCSFVASALVYVQE